MENESIKGYKGFDENLKCRDFQYESGKDYEEKGEIRACNNGFHYCENPFDVLGYYPPATKEGDLTRYCEVQGSEVIDRTESDKIACSKIHIGIEIGLRGLISAGVKFIIDKVNWGNKEKNTGDQSAATNTGDQSAATNTGDQSAATNTGNWSAATNTGDWSAATNTGNRSAATNTGDRSAAIAEGMESIAIVTGKESKAKGKIGCWLVLTERGDWNGETYPIKMVKAYKVDGIKIKEDTFYQLINGKIKEV